jgi:hypothetical protein
MNRVSADDLTQAQWRKSSYSTGGGSNCVEVGSVRDTVVVRDSKQAAGSVLTIRPGAWQRFIASVKARETTSRFSSDL